MKPDAPCTMGELAGLLADVELQRVWCKRRKIYRCHEIVTTVSPQTIAGQLARRARCKRCGGHGAQVLAWLPAPPRGK